MKSYKLIAFVVLAIFLLQRLWSNYSSKRRAKQNSVLLNSDETAMEFAESLDMLIYTEKADLLPFLNEKLPFNTPMQMGDFKISLSKKIDDDTYLFATLCKYIDLEGRNTVENFIDLNFKLLKDGEKVKIYSDLFTNLIDKNLRTDFAIQLLQEIKK